MPTKTSSARKLLSPTKARNAALINQLATPGLGTLMVGRIGTGLGQLAIALIGFGFFLAWFVALLMQFYGQIEGDVAVRPVGWLAQVGAGLFLAAWGWSLVTSISLIREARRNAPAAFADIPPRLPPVST
jgi:hypothetical protein